jgi:branched-chain amino acid transport system permease protein
MLKSCLVVQGDFRSFGSWYLIILGVFTIFIMLKAPQGLWGMIAKRFNIHLFAVRRHVVSAVSKE